MEFEVVVDVAGVALLNKNIAAGTSSRESHESCVCYSWPLGTLVKLSFLGYLSDSLIIWSKEEVVRE